MTALNLPPKELPVQPLTREEMRVAAEQRITKISNEFKEGFKFIEDYPKSVTFFGSSRVKEDNAHYNKARNLAKRIVEELHYSVLTGGGPGIMEAANRGAFEVGGPSLGLNIKLEREQAINPYVTDHTEFYYFFSRKVCLSFSAEAYIFFPGGFGTFDELFEIITLVQTKKIEKVPVFLVGREYWEPLDKFIREQMLARDTVDEEDIKLYRITDDEDEIIKANCPTGVCTEAWDCVVEDVVNPISGSDYTVVYLRVLGRSQ